MVLEKMVALVATVLLKACTWEADKRLSVPTGLWRRWVSEWTCDGGDLVALGPGHPPHYSSKGVRVKGCKGPAFGIFTELKYPSPRSLKNFVDKPRRCQFFALPNMWRTTRRKPGAKCHGV